VNGASVGGVVGMNGGGLLSGGAKIKI